MTIEIEIEQTQLINSGSNSAAVCYIVSRCRDVEANTVASHLCRIKQNCVWVLTDDDTHAQNSPSQPIRVPQFHGDSFITVPLKRTPSRSLSFEIWFLTFEPNGKNDTLITL